MEKNPDIIWELNIVQTEEERARVDMLADQSMDFRYYETDAESQSMLATLVICLQ